MAITFKLKIAIWLAFGVCFASGCADSNFASSEPQASRSSSNLDQQRDNDGSIDRSNRDKDDDDHLKQKDDDDLSRGEDDDLDIEVETDDDAEDDLDLTEDEFKATLPGVEVQRVGVNFEDDPNGDFDYNDAVFCFTGMFKLDGSKAVSFKEQTVDVALTNRSGQNHDYEIYVEHEDGTKSAAVTGKTRFPQSISLSFKRGSVLFAKIVTEQRNVYDIHNGTQARVLPDQCNVTGD